MKICLGVIILNFSFLGIRFYQNHLKTVPETGGEYREGLVGTPKYLNPLFSSLNDVDSDISQLVFSSLFKRDREGKLAGDLVESYKTSPDGKTYDLKIRPNIKWHDKENLTVDDIVFTFSAIKYSEYKSSLYSSFGGVELQKVDDQNIRFTLTESYAAFLDLLTFGIIPQRLWEQIPPSSARLAELNLKPIGSGPYKFKSLVKDKNGNIRAINLILNPDYYGPKAYIKEVDFYFYPAYEEMVSALNDNQIDGINYLPKSMKSNIVAAGSYNFNKLVLPQLTAVFFNPANNGILADKKVRQALNYALPKEKLVNEILGKDDYNLIYSPISSDSPYYFSEIKKYENNLAEAEKLLKDAEWQSGELNDEAIKKAQEDLNSKDADAKAKAETIIAMGKGKWLLNKSGKYFILRLTTVDVEENSKTAQFIKESWEKIGVKVEVQLLPVEEIQNLVKNKDYEALLYGITQGADPDPYAYWHSSQAEKGLNIANYSNKTVDALLEDARATLNAGVRKDKYKKFQEIIADDVPAIFLYSPIYDYIQSKSIKNYGVIKIYAPADRLSDINEWYIKTNKKIVW
jgi:peptide/nickel transport system substrate-binding protein